MRCNDLADRIQQLRPDADPREVARLCLLLSNAAGDLDSLTDERQLQEMWRQVDIRMQAVTDQHEAMTEELELLARTSPQKFQADQVWTLIRAIKVQGQILQMYLGESESCC